MNSLGLCKDNCRIVYELGFMFWILLIIELILVSVYFILLYGEIDFVCINEVGVGVVN